MTDMGKATGKLSGFGRNQGHLDAALEKFMEWYNNDPALAGTALTPTEQLHIANAINMMGRDDRAARIALLLHGYFQEQGAGTTPDV